MIKKSITYKDYNGDEHTEDFYFHMTKAEFNELYVSVYGVKAPDTMHLFDEKNAGKFIEFYKNFILNSVGQKSIDGRRFIKNEDIREAFQQTEAYSNLFCELVENPGDELNKFVNGVLGIEYRTPAAAPVVAIE